MAAQTYSKQVIQQMTHAETLLNLARKVQPRILRELDLHMKIPGQAEEEGVALSAALGPALVICLEHLEALTEALSSADLEHSRRLTEYRIAVRTRTQVLRSSLKKVASTKEALSGIYGKAFLKELGMAGETPREPLPLRAWLELVIFHLSAEDRVWPTPTLPGVHFGREYLLEALQPLLQSISEAIETTDEKAQLQTGTQVDKNELIAQHQNAYAAVAHICESYARLAQQHELATRMRPKASRKARRTKGR